MDWEKRRTFNIKYREQKEKQQYENQKKRYSEQIRKTQEKNYKSFIEKFHSGYFDEFLENYEPRWDDITEMSDYECKLFDELYEKYIEEHKW